MDIKKFYEEKIKFNLKHNKIAMLFGLFVSIAAFAIPIGTVWFFCHSFAWQWQALKTLTVIIVSLFVLCLMPFILMACLSIIRYLFEKYILRLEVWKD